jgi:hypothetical protein
VRLATVTAVASSPTLATVACAFLPLSLSKNEELKRPTPVKQGDSRNGQGSLKFSRRTLSAGESAYLPSLEVVAHRLALPQSSTILVGGHTDDIVEQVR